MQKKGISVYNVSMKKALYIIGGIFVAAITGLVIAIPQLLFLPLLVYSWVFPITSFELVGNTLTMNNLITSKTPGQVYEIFEEYPNIDTIEMRKVDGSIDDDSNLEISTWLSTKDLTIKINRYSTIASGGTDFFLAGANRIVVDGAKVGVHSWASSGGDTAADFPRDHESHQPYIKYYQDIGFSPEESDDFYFFTIYAAPANDIYFMENYEIVDYKVTTTGISEPEFIVREFEESFKEEGRAYISDAEALSRGIEVIDEEEYNRRLKERNPIKF